MKSLNIYFTTTTSTNKQKFKNKKERHENSLQQGKTILIQPQEKSQFVKEPGTKIEILKKKPDSYVHDVWKEIQ